MSQKPEKESIDVSAARAVLSASIGVREAEAATASRDGRVTVWSLASMAALCKFSVPRPVAALYLDDERDRVVLADDQLTFWQHDLRGDDPPKPMQMRVHPVQGELFVRTSENRFWWQTLDGVSWFDLVGDTIRTADVPFGVDIADFAVSPDGRRCVIADWGSDFDHLEIVNLSSQKAVPNIESLSPMAVSIDNAGRIAAIETGSLDAETVIRVVDADTRSDVAKFPVHCGEALRIAVVPNHPAVVSLHRGGEIAVVSLDPVSFRIVETGWPPAQALAVSCSGKWAVTGDVRGNVRLIDVRHLLDHKRVDEFANLLAR